MKKFARIDSADNNVLVLVEGVTVVNGVIPEPDYVVTKKDVVEVDVLPPMHPDVAAQYREVDLTVNVNELFDPTTGTSTPLPTPADLPLADRVAALAVRLQQRLVTRHKQQIKFVTYNGNTVELSADNMTYIMAVKRPKAKEVDDATWGSYQQITRTGFVSLDRGQMLQLADAIEDHVDDMTDILKQHFADIQALVSAEDMIVLEVYDVDTGWPAPII